MKTRPLMIMLAFAIAFAAVVGFGASSASAQDTCGGSYPDPCPTDSQAPQLQGPGNIKNTPDSVPATEPDADSIPAATAEPAAADDSPPAPQLAFTGSETDALTYVGAGLIATGAVALVARRRMLRED